MASGEWVIGVEPELLDELFDELLVREELLVVLLDELLAVLLLLERVTPELLDGSVVVPVISP